MSLLRNALLAAFVLVGLHRPFAQILYIESAPAMGVNHMYGSGAPGGGISFCDFDGDGADDLTLGGLAGVGISFYRYSGDKLQKMETLADVPYEVKQILWVDTDNDGDKDLYVACYDGHNMLFRNEGSLDLVDVTAASGLSTEIHRGFGALWADFNRDGLLDVFYVKRRTDQDTFLNENKLYLNHPSGIFTDATEAAGVADRGKKPFCAVAFDYDNDKWPDIYINNDRQTINTLLHNEGNGIFADVGEATGANVKMDAMGTALGDYDNDGLLDLYVSNIPDGNVLLHNDGPDGNDQYRFTDLAAQANCGFYSVAWGTNFLDADNDGDLDLYVSGMLPGTAATNSTLYENLGDGTFRNLEGQLEGDTCISFSNATGDINQDGIVDIGVVNQGEFRTQLWVSQVPLIPNRSIKIGLQGVLSNRDGIGTRIELWSNGRYQMRYTHCGISFMGQNSSWETFGLGTAESADSIRITWPTGHVDRLYSLPAILSPFRIVEGESTGGVIHVDPDITLATSVQREGDNTPGTITVFPNPAGDRLWLSEPTFGTVHIVNVEGRNVLSFSMSGQTSLDIAILPAGLYMLQMFEANRNRSAKFVKR
jgi:hypothetical protein